MADGGTVLKAARDGFVDLARYYDAIMAHVDYNRWYFIAGALTQLLPDSFTHLDAACGTCVLLNKFRRAGWRSFGIDLSHAMIRRGHEQKKTTHAAAADLRALPINNSLDYVTCLFDSVNFLLKEDDLRRAFKDIAGAMAPNGILYFDIVTERMVLEHFADQTWNERNGRFTTTWECTYDRTTATAETLIRVNNGPPSTLYERIYERETIHAALKDAGFEILAEADAEHWRAPSRKSVRIDYVAVKGPARALEGPFRKVRKQIRSFFA